LKTVAPFDPVSVPAPPPIFQAGFITGVREGDYPKG
jgi:hypothetical protein